MKILRFAHLKQIITFDSEEKLEQYLKNLRCEYEVLNKKIEDSGSVTVLIIKSYNRTPLLTTEDVNF